MDDIVRAALMKWPHVPHCYGWLALDARGDWYMRDERTQRTGPFPQVKGSRIVHDKLREFIERNYDADRHGGWYFQNGPQRVYVELEAAPLVWRLSAVNGAPPTLQSHTGRKAVYQSAWLDEHDRLFVAANIGLGIVHTLDMATAADAVEQGHWVPALSTVAALAERFGHQLSPQSQQVAQSLVQPKAAATSPGR